MKNKFISLVFLVTSFNVYTIQSSRFSLQNSNFSVAQKQAIEHNVKNPLLVLPDELLEPILAHSIDTTKPLENAIKTALTLRSTCQSFNTLLSPKMIGTACKGYDETIKNKCLKKIVFRINDANCWNKGIVPLILVYAGTTDNADLLKNAVRREDISMITTLFEQGTSPNATDSLKRPIFSA